MKLLSNGNIYPIKMHTRPNKMVSRGTLQFLLLDTQPRMGMELETICLILIFCLEATSGII
jgi:hypothetical protein